MAPSSRSPSITASTIPACSACAAATGWPPVHISSASTGPHKRGSRWVPPAPGMIPRCTSGWPRLGRGDGHAVMTRHGELEAAAEGMTVNGGHERLVGVLQPFQTRVHHLRAFDGLLARLQLLEHVDVRTGDERRARADQDDRVRGRIVAGARDGLADALGNAGAQGIHGWVVDGDDGNAVPHLVPNQR